jgi:hypothetical protein
MQAWKSRRIGPCSSGDGSRIWKRSFFMTRTSIELAGVIRRRQLELCRSNRDAWDNARVDPVCAWRCLPARGGYDSQRSGRCPSVLSAAFWRRSFSSMYSHMRKRSDRRKMCALRWTTGRPVDVGVKEISTATELRSCRAKGRPGGLICRRTICKGEKA